MRRKPCRTAPEKASGSGRRKDRSQALQSQNVTIVCCLDQTLYPLSWKTPPSGDVKKRDRSLSRMVGRRRGRLPFYAKTNIQRSAVPLQGSSEHLFKLRYGCGSLVPIRSRGSAYERVKIVGLASADQNISAICTPY